MSQEESVAPPQWFGPQELSHLVGVLTQLRRQYASLVTPPINFLLPGPGQPPVLDRTLSWHTADQGAQQLCRTQPTTA